MKMNIVDGTAVAMINETMQTSSILLVTTLENGTDIPDWSVLDKVALENALSDRV